MARPRAPGHDDQRTAILGHAAALFAAQGYPSTTMTQVAAAAGLSKAALYHYVADKQQLLREIAHAQVDALHASVAEVIDAFEPAGTAGSAGSGHEPPERALVRALIERLVMAYDGQADALRVLTDEVRYLERMKDKAGLDQYFSTLASSRPQIYSLFWSKPQMMARQNPSLDITRSWLNRLWRFEKNGTRFFDPDRQFNYADRIRRREPGDSTLGLSPHSDGGSVERWCEPTFRHVYRDVFEGDPLAFDPFDADGRATTREIPSPAVCSSRRSAAWRWSGPRATSSSRGRRPAARCRCRRRWSPRSGASPGRASTARTS